MLIVKIFVNTEQIDEIHIQNVKKVSDIANGIFSGVYEYVIKEPEGYSDNSIFHIRKTGYIPLLLKALKVMQDYKMGLKVKE